MVDPEVKVVYWLLGIGAGALVAYWLVASPVGQVQVDPGPTEVPGAVYDPVTAGEQTPDGYRQLLARDAILPIYNPRFRSVTETTWSAETLIIGVELDGEAKAYPVHLLNRREMVVDWIGGTPILVSW